MRILPSAALVAAGLLAGAAIPLSLGPARDSPAGPDPGRPH